jgi:hypothetical protein
LDGDEHGEHLVGRHGGDALELGPDRPLLWAQPVVSHPSGLDQRERGQALGVLSGKRQAGCAAARVADQVKAVKAGGLSGAKDAVDLVLERVAGRGRGVGVHLEVLRDRADVVAERIEQRAIGELGGHDRARKEDRLRRHWASLARIPSTKDSTSGAAGSMRWPPATSAV